MVNKKIKNKDFALDLFLKINIKINKKNQIKKKYQTNNFQKELKIHN